MVKEDFQFPECEKCSKFPCYIEGLYQWNGVCLDFDAKVTKVKRPKKTVKTSDLVEDFLRSELYGKLKEENWVLIHWSVYNELMKKAQLWPKKSIPKDAKGFIFVDLEGLEGK